MRDGAVPIQGAVRKGPVSVKLGFASDDYGYAIDLGLPIASRSAFDRDPEIKVETVWAGPVLRRANALAVRKGPHVEITGSDGKRRTVLQGLAGYDSMMTHAADPRGAPELLEVRERMRGWRFYDHIRTDRDAPARRSHVGTRTVALASDGGDLAAAIQTILEIGDHAAFHAAIEDAFPGAAVEIETTPLFAVGMRQHGLLRPLVAAELSDGTLHYLALVAALLTPRPPSLMVLNEPETSLHPDLLVPLGRLIIAASARSQIVVVSHAGALINAVARHADAACLKLTKVLGETYVDGERPAWHWPSRS
jgi:predicted ATPase